LRTSVCQLLRVQALQDSGQNRLRLSKVVPEFEEQWGEGLQWPPGRALAPMHVPVVLLDHVEELLQGIVCPGQIRRIVAVEQVAGEARGDLRHVDVESASCCP